MKVLILLRDRSTNGITTYNRILAAELARQGHQVEVWPDRNGLIGLIGLITLPWLHPALEPLARWRLRRWRPDVIIANHYTQARLAQRLRQTTGTPWVACMHNGHSPRRMAQWAALFGSASGVVTMCETLRDEYTRLVGDSSPPVFLSRLPMALPPPQPRTHEQPLTLAYCARLSSQKGPRCETWLKAIASLPEPARYRVLVIGGGSYLGRLRSTAAALGLNVEFTGMVKDPAPWLARTDVITGAGYALMEGLLQGCAAVGLGFGGCIGAITNAGLAEAMAVNFGDHCDRPYPDDIATVARALQTAMDTLGTAESAALRQRMVQTFSASPVVAGLAGFLAQVSIAAQAGERAVLG